MRAAKLLIGQHDFTAFAKRHSDVTHHLCTVTQAEWNKLGRGEWVFRIEANRFLRSMVRALVGTLIEVGSGRLTAKEFGEILHRAEEYHFNTAPATGLRLEAGQLSARPPWHHPLRNPQQYITKKAPLGGAFLVDD